MTERPLTNNTESDAVWGCYKNSSVCSPCKRERMETCIQRQPGTMWHVQLGAERRRAAVILQCVLGRNKGRQGSFVRWKQNPDKTVKTGWAAMRFWSLSWRHWGCGSSWCLWGLAKGLLTPPWLLMGRGSSWTLGELLDSRLCPDSGHCLCPLAPPCRDLWAWIESP